MEQNPWSAASQRSAEDSAEESVIYLIKRVRLSIAEAADRQLAPQGITRAQMGPLYVLRSTKASTVAELARELRIDAGSMSKMLDRLEAKGLCRRLRSTDDRRVVRIELTSEGQTVANRLMVELAGVMNAHLAGFSSAEWTQLKGFLQRLLHNADALSRLDDGSLLKNC